MLEDVSAAGTYLYNYPFRAASEQLPLSLGLVVRRFVQAQLLQPLTSYNSVQLLVVFWVGLC